MGNKEPSSAFCLFFGGGERRNGGLGENGDAAGARAGSEIRRVRVYGTEEWDYMGVDCAFR